MWYECEKATKEGCLVWKAGERRGQHDLHWKFHLCSPYKDIIHLHLLVNISSPSMVCADYSSTLDLLSTQHTDTSIQNKDLHT